MSDIFEKAIVQKQNILNEIRANNLTLQELRFFSIYLSKINSRDISTRTVKFKLTDFQKIMNFKELKISQLRSATDSLLTKLVHLPKESGGYSTFQLFKKCDVDKDETGEWFVLIDAHDDALPLMFDFKDRYFKYELWNALRLKSANQIRMYEILKQYETIGKREIKVDDLRELLGIAPNEYPRWDRFKDRVIDSCQQALKQFTDICYTYERGKTGTGGKWITIIFYISKNIEYDGQMTMLELDLQNYIDLDALKEGVELIFQKLLKVLEAQGLKKIETHEADFNTDFHEAIAMVPAANEEQKGKVVDCVQTGYTLNDKVIRHAKVAIGQ